MSSNTGNTETSEESGQKSRIYSDSVALTHSGIDLITLTTVATTNFSCQLQCGAPALILTSTSQNYCFCSQRLPEITRHTPVNLGFFILLSPKLLLRYILLKPAVDEKVSAYHLCMQKRRRAFSAEQIHIFQLQQ